MSFNACLPLDMLFALMPHGSCYLWDPWLTSLHVSTDLAIAFSYLAITFQLTFFLRKYPQTWLGQQRLITYGFILFCGLGHTFSAWNVWHSNYWSEGALKMAIAIASWSAVWAVQLSQARVEQVITELKTAETQRQTLQTILETNLDGVMAFSAIRDANGKIADFQYVLVNQAAAEMAGQSDLIGKRLLDIAPYHLENGVFDLYCQVTETGKSAELEFEYEGKEYQNRWFRIHSSKLADGFLVSFTEVTNYKQAEAQLRQQATTDTLTRISNRSILEAADLENINAVLFVDLDKFKNINDRVGHKIGDLVLIEIAQRLQSAVRPCDRVIRWGGDEFVILISDRCGEQVNLAYDTAEQIVAKIEQPIQLEMREYLLSASIGVYRLPPEPIPLEQAIRRADAAMYEAKQLRRQEPMMPAIARFDESILLKMQERDHWEEDLRTAIEQQHLVLYYQPIVDLQAEDFPIIGFETLLRWQHPEHGLIYPDFFIPIAERSGLIHLISQYVLRRAYDQAIQWSSPNCPIKMGINLCVDDLSHSTFLSAIEETLNQKAIGTSCIFFEITETSISDIAISEVRAAAHQIKKIGGNLSLDDFGTGRNTLCCLQWNVFDSIKIDRSFVSGAEAMPKICQLVTSLAHGLDLEVVAEGVETAEQAHMLKSFGVKYAQGYYFGKPHPPAVIEQTWYRGKACPTLS
ncbi:MAG: putative bifunctional diguanylate cyclase/phosphodiesterase [Almyronema sp.]